MKKTKIALVLTIALVLLLPILAHVANAAYTADLNGDGQVNATDLGIIKNDFLKLAAALANPKSDIDADGQCLVKDVGIMMSAWGTVPVPPPTSAAFNTYVLANPISSTPILPTTVMSNPSSNITLQAAKDQYQSASFVVRAGTADVTNLLATPSALTSGSNTIPASAVDIRAVKAWYQSGAPTDEFKVSGVRNLTPELLLHNDNLIRVDLTGKNNYLEMPSGGELNISTDTQATPNLIQPTDTAALQSLNIPANNTKQFWITLHVPSNAAAGTYTGTISLASANAGTTNMNITLTVSNFTLEQPNLTYGMYYFGHTSSSYPNGTIGEHYKSTAQLTGELQGLLQHGVRYPMVDTPLSNTADLTRRISLGFPTDYLFWITMGGWPGSALPSVSTITSYTASYLAAARAAGFSNFVNFGVDEADSSVLTNEIPLFQAIHTAGGKNIVADYNTNSPSSQFQNLLDFVAWPNAAWTNPSLAIANWHAKGAKVFDYEHPYSEDPLVARRRFGWALYKAGFDGNFDFAYQYYYGSNEDSGGIWNDFSIPVGQERTQILAYPTTNGVVDTVQYEGYREGINDMRYLATLQKAIAAHPGTVATAAQNWINSIDPNGDLDAYRKTMTDYITQLVP